MMRLPRRVMLWGGAAAIAAGGFAFMDTNSVSASSAGESAGVVTGYNVTNISFATIDNHYYNNFCNYPVGCKQMPGAAATSVTFTLTAATKGAAPGGQPTNVDVYPLDGNHLAQWGHDNGCTVTSWTAGSDTGPTAGTGTVTCSLAPEVPISQLKYLEVEANQ